MTMTYVNDQLGIGARAEHSLHEVFGLNLLSPVARAQIRVFPCKRGVLLQGPLICNQLVAQGLGESNQAPEYWFVGVRAVGSQRPLMNEGSGWVKRLGRIVAVADATQCRQDLTNELTIQR